jgi:hypothetical protein
MLNADRSFDAPAAEKLQGGWGISYEALHNRDVEKYLTICP